MSLSRTEAASLWNKRILSMWYVTGRAALVAFVVVSSYAAANPSCGQPAEGLRLCLEWNSASQDQPLSIVLENVGTSGKDITLSYGFTGAFEFIVAGPDEVQRTLVDRQLYVPLGGFLPPPAVERVAAGGCTQISCLPGPIHLRPQRAGHVQKSGFTTGGWLQSASVFSTEQINLGTDQAFCCERVDWASNFRPDSLPKSITNRAQPFNLRKTASVNSAVDAVPPTSPVRHLRSR